METHVAGFVKEFGTKLDLSGCLQHSTDRKSFINSVFGKRFRTAQYSRVHLNIHSSKLMYKTSVYTLVNGAITHQKPQI